MALNYLTDTSEVRVVVRDSESGNEIDFSNVTRMVRWETFLEGQAGRASVEIVTSNGAINTIPQEGSNLVIEVKSEKVFDGFVFTHSLGSNEILTLNAYDRLRYLNNADSFVFEESTLGDVFSKICSTAGVSGSDNSGASVTLDPIIHDNATYYSMLQRAMDETVIRGGPFVIVRDAAGSLQLDDVTKLTPNPQLKIGDAQLLTGYSFISSIDRYTYNKIKIVSNSTQSKIHEVYTTEDNENTSKWGLLQRLEVLTGEQDEAKITEYANAALKAYNKKRRALSVTCLGDVRVFAGVGLMVEISGLANEGLGSEFSTFCLQAEHTIENELHKMKLRLYVPDA